jgi:hypothetical protein
MGLFSKGLREREASHYERQVALLQEQLADARSDAQRHCERADRAVDELVKVYGLRAISNTGQREAAQRAERTEQIAERATQRADLLFEEVPFGDPRGRYRALEEASLDNEEIEPALPPLAMFIGKAN